MSSVKVSSVKKVVLTVFHQLIFCSIWRGGGGWGSADFHLSLGCLDDWEGADFRIWLNFRNSFPFWEALTIQKWINFWKVSNEPCSTSMPYIWTKYCRFLGTRRCLRIFTSFHFTDTSGSPAYAGLALDSGHMPTRSTLKVYNLVKSHWQSL